MLSTGVGYLMNYMNLSPEDSSNSNSLDELKIKVISGRVIDIILDETHPKFTEYGDWNSIGTINFEPIDQLNKKNKIYPIAKPLFPQFNAPPLINEIVLLIHLPDKDMGKNDTSKLYYYLSSVSIWNHPHHNAYPNVYKYSNINNTGSKNIDLNGDNPTGGKFDEKSNISPLIPFSGDNIIESRFGSSLRLGSTKKTKSLISNNWSDSGDNGDPITILRNGQPPSKNNIGFFPIVEKINEDPSSIYMTTTQNIPISASSLNYTAISSKQTPTYPNSYSDAPQIILNSGRLLLNSTSDSILLSSKKVINLAALEDIGLASRKSITLEAEEINLGGTNSSQPAIAGQTFLANLKNLTFALEALANAINNDPKVGPVTQFAGNNLNEVLKEFNESYDSFTSKKVKLS